MRRIGKRVLWGLLALEALYILSVGVFLNLPRLLPRLLNADPAVFIRHRFAWSWYPGQLWVWGLEVGIQDPKTQVYFHARGARLHVDLGSLRNREFRALSPSLSGLTVALRPVSEKPDPDWPVLPPFPIPGPKKNPRPPEQHWKVRLENLVADSPDLWFDRYHFRGDARVEGGLFLHTGGYALEVPATVLEVLTGTVRVGEKGVAEKLKARVDYTLRRIAPRDFPGRKILGAMDATVDVDSAIGGLGLLNYALRDLKGVRFAQAQGTVRAYVEVRGGHVKAPSKVEVSAPNVEVDLWKQVLCGDVTMLGRFEKGRPVLNARLSNYGLRFQRREATAIRGRNLRLTFRAPKWDLAQAHLPIGVHLQMPRADLGDLVSLNAFLPRAAAVRFAGGKAFVEADLYAGSEPSSPAHGTLRLRAEQAKLSVRGEPLWGNLLLDVPLQRALFDKGLLDISGTELRLRNGKFGSDKNWWMTLRIPNARWRFHEGVHAVADVRMEARDLRPLLNVYLAAGKESLPGIVRDLFTFEGLRARSHIEVDDKSLEIRDFHAHSETTQVWGWLKENSLARDGRVLMQVGPFAAGLQIEDRQMRLRLNDAVTWFGPKPVY